MTAAPRSDPRRDPLHTGLILATFLVMDLIALGSKSVGLDWRLATMIAAPVATGFCCAVPFFLHRLPEIHIRRERRLVYHYVVLAMVALTALTFLALHVPWWVVFATYVLSALAVYMSYQVFAFVLTTR
jgi:hypothetical protein